jgi:hypothetical protein
VQAHVSSFRFFFLDWEVKIFFPLSQVLVVAVLSKQQKKKQNFFVLTLVHFQNLFFSFSRPQVHVRPLCVRAPQGGRRQVPDLPRAGRGPAPYQAAGSSSSSGGGGKRRGGLLKRVARCFFVFFFAEKRKHGCTVCEQQVFVSLLLSLSLLPYCSLFIDACVGQTKKETEKKK